ncbi:MAG: dioxygenase, partial [Rhodospirillales bacterium]|nr:dioxygenase [Rhodospirillales bacterium]
MVLVPGAPKRLRHLSFGARADELAALKGRLEANRVRLLDSPAVCGGEGLWFEDPDGFLLNVRVAEAAPWAS